VDEAEVAFHRRVEPKRLTDKTDRFGCWSELDHCKENHQKKRKRFDKF
jgi:hypothetical protein